MNLSNIISSFSKQVRAVMHQDPVRDWLILVTLSLLAFVGIIVWNISAFGMLTKGGVTSAPVLGARSVFSHTSLEAIHTIFTNRASEQEKYVTGVYHYSDPSQ